MRTTHLVLALSTAWLAVPAAAQSTGSTTTHQTATGEIGYALGSLGFDAIVAGDLATAERQIVDARDTAADDPARLLNLGYIHMRTGRVQSARRLFETVKNQRSGIMLQLANGEVAESRIVARRALARMTPALANR
jgi:Tfp pilus assembly protein PilF